MNARELLKEARSYVNSMEVEYQHRNEGGYYEEELRRAVDLKDRIDAYLAAPSASAMETVGKVREMIGSGSAGANFYGFTTSDSDAAAMIESGRRVPRKVLREIWLHKHEFANAFTLDEILDIIAKEHGVEVTE